MKKSCKKARGEACSCKCDNFSASAPKKRPDAETRIYDALNTAERIAVKLAQINQILKDSRKKKKKKNKKLGKVDKKTGTLILKGQKRHKKVKALKRQKNNGAASKQ